MIAEPEWEFVPEEYNWAILKEVWNSVYWIYVKNEPIFKYGSYHAEYPIFSRRDFESFPKTDVIVTDYKRKRPD